MIRKLKTARGSDSKRQRIFPRQQGTLVIANDSNASNGITVELPSGVLSEGLLQLLVHGYLTLSTFYPVFTLSTECLMLRNSQFIINFLKPTVDAIEKIHPYWTSIESQPWLTVNTVRRSMVDSLTHAHSFTQKYPDDIYHYIANNRISQHAVFGSPHTGDVLIEPLPPFRTQLRTPTGHISKVAWYHEWLVIPLVDRCMCDSKPTNYAIAYCLYHLRPPIVLVYNEYNPDDSELRCRITARDTYRIPDTLEIFRSYHSELSKVLSQICLE